MQILHLMEKSRCGRSHLVHGLRSDEVGIALAAVGERNHNLLQLLASKSLSGPSPSSRHAFSNAL